MSRKLSPWQKYLISKEISVGKLASYGMIQKMMIRKPLYKFQRQHPNARKIFNKMIQKPLPLRYKLKEYDPKCLNEPLGVSPEVSFFVDRTHTNNLPVYSEFKDYHQVKKTVVRRISGNVGHLVSELKKITSNSDVEVKVGRVEIKGIHVDKVKDYLYRLGF